MKSRQQTTSVVMAIGIAALLGVTSCNEDWGQMDPPAGNQVYPTLQNVKSIAFEDEEGNTLLPAGYAAVLFGDDAVADVVTDEVAQSPVLTLNHAYATFDNPLNDVECQAGVSVSFWMRQPIEVDEEGNALTKQDLRTPLFAFVNPKKTSEEANEPAVAAATTDNEIYGSLVFTANGRIGYDADNGLLNENDPDEFLTGYLTADDWHFVVLNINDEGYGIYVDGMRKVDKVIPNFDCHKMVEFANKAPLFCVNGTPDSEEAPALIVDDVTFYRNNVTPKEVKMPKKGNIGNGAAGEVDNTNYFIFGPEDNVQGWWTIWSPSVNLVGDGVIHYEFINHTIGNNNWENWVLVLTNSGKSPNDDGYDGSQELIVLRADAWGWGGYWNPDNASHDYNWDTFTKDMQGAFVTIDIIRKGDTVKMVSKTTTVDGQTFNYSYQFSGYEDSLLGSFFTLENAHLQFYADETFAGKEYASGSYTLGNQDMSSAFWTCWTPVEKFDKPFQNFGFELINHSACGGNWQFWNLVVTNGLQSGANEDGYAEQLYLRCDAWGWASRWDGAELIHGFDWSTFISDMNDAKSKIYFSYDNGTLTMVARQYRADGSEIPEYRFSNNGFTLPLGLIFTCESAWLDFLRIGYYPWIDLTPKEAE